MQGSENRFLALSLSATASVVLVGAWARYRPGEYDNGPALGLLGLAVCMSLVAFPVEARGSDHSRNPVARLVAFFVIVAAVAIFVYMSQHPFVEGRPNPYR